MEQKTLRQEAEEFEIIQIGNIAELESVNIDDVFIKEEEHKDKDGEIFKVKFFKLNDIKYRVPSSVLEGIKTILKRFPDTKNIAVDKNGSGLNTKYNVLPMNNQTQEKVQ